MKTLPSLLLAAAVLVLSPVARAECERAAQEVAKTHLGEKLREMPKFATGDLSLDDSNIGKYENGVTVKATSKTEVMLEVTLVGLVTNESSKDSEFMVQRCVLIMKLGSCQIAHQKCTVM